MRNTEVLPPQDLDAERALIGSCMMEGTILDEVSPVIDAAMFYLPEHRVIWTAMTKTRERGDPMDLLATEAALRRMEAPVDRDYMVQLSESFADITSFAYYRDVVLEHHQRRQLISTGIRMTKAGFTIFDEPKEIAAKFVKELEANISTGVPKARSTADRLRELPEHLTGRTRSFVMTGLEHFDRNFHGLERGTLTIIGAHTGVGKTALALSICIDASTNQEIPSVFFTIEMPSKAIDTRITANLSGKSMNALRTRSTADDLRHDVEVTIGKLKAEIITRDEFTNVRDIVSTAKTHVRRDGVGLVVIDYLQLVTPSGRSENRNLAVAEMSALFKRLAMDTNTAVVVLSQLRRGGDSKPALSDLRDSGSIEQDADICILLHRPDNNAPDRGAVDLTVHIAKNRQGACGMFTVKFDRPRMTFRCEPMAAR